MLLQVIELIELHLHVALSSIQRFQVAFKRLKPFCNTIALFSECVKLVLLVLGQALAGVPIGRLTRFGWLHLLITVIVHNFG